MYSEVKECINYMLEADKRLNLNHDLIMISEDYFVFINQKTNKHLTCKTAFNRELIEFLIISDNVKSILKAENIIFSTTDYIKNILKTKDRIL